MKKSVILIGSVLLLSVQTFGQNEKDYQLNPQNKVQQTGISEAVYPEITITPFPILSFIPPALTKEQMGWFEEAGFNVMTIHPDPEAYSLLKKFWTGNWMLTKDFNLKGYDYKAMCDFHPEDPKRIGFMLGDEPVTKMLDTYKEQADFLRSRYPDEICLVNMFPSYVNQTLLESTYRVYMDTYFEKLKPAYASLDNYPCYRNGYEGTTYYHDLEMMRETTQKNNCRIIGFVQVYSSAAMRDISSSDLAWQVNSLLAYGSKGLWYFYFRNPVPGINDLAGKEIMKDNKKDSVWNFQKGRIMEPCGDNVFEFGSGVLNAKDQKGERFNDVAQVNKETLAWGDLLIQLNSLKVRHILGFTEAYPPVGADDFTRKDWSGVVEKYVSKIVTTDPAQSMGYILSYFEDSQKQQYIMIVNKKHGENITRESGSLPTIIAFTDEVKNVYLVSNKSSKEEAIQLDALNSFKRNIDAGGALLLRLELNQKEVK
jgi:hypothetical protein